MSEQDPKPVNDKAYTLRMPNDLYKELARQALEEGKRVNEKIIEILRQAQQKQG